MHCVQSRMLGIVGLVLLLRVGTSWGGPPDLTSRDTLGNTAGGSGALYSNTIGAYNTASGYYTLYSNTTGGINTAVGAAALYSNTTGIANTAVGLSTLYSNTTGYYNVAVGADVLYNNTAVGGITLVSNTTGSGNTVVGRGALVTNTTGSGNTVVGAYVLDLNPTGASNTAVGFEALYTNTTGSGNIAVGSGAGATLTSGDNNIYLGNPGAAIESNTIRLGQVQTRTFIAGITSVPVRGSAILISSTGQLGIQASAARYKHDIQPMGTRSQGLRQLRPVTFRYTQDGQGERQYGLIAEEVAKTYPELVTYGANGEIESVRYQELIPMLLNELQHQQRQLEAQRQQLTVQAQQLAELKAQNERLRAAVVQQQKRDVALAARLERLEDAAARTATLASR
jgi:hypothetical protein